MDILKNISRNIPERLKVGLRYTYGLCDLDAYAMPITEEEFANLSCIYQEANSFVDGVENAGFRYLLKELYYIQRTASDIPGFKEGQLVNETEDPVIWRKYVYLDFFKFSLINTLIRETSGSINQSTDEVIASKYILSYFLGLGSYIERTSLLFTDNGSTQLREMVRTLCSKIEITPEFPDLKFEHYFQDYNLILKHVQSERLRTLSNADCVTLYRKLRYKPFEVCNEYYKNYYQAEQSSQLLLAPMTNIYKRPVLYLFKLYEQISKAEHVDIQETKSTLRLLRTVVDKKFNAQQEYSEKFTVKNFLEKTSHPYFQAIALEGKILSILFRAEYPETGINYTSIFQELVPFYAVKFAFTGKLFDFNLEAKEDLPKLVVAHHVYNADCNTIRNKILINKLLLWNSEKTIFNISSSSSNIKIVLKERECCLETGFNHYRIHARQHLKAGNQNRAFFNAIECKGREYYLTLDDDFFCFPDYPLSGHKEIVAGNLDYFQALNVYSGSYDLHTVGEKTDAELMQHFETTLGFCKPELFMLPRGSGTIFHFVDGKNSLSDTGGFLVDYSSEDFGQGFLAQIQKESSVYGKAKYSLTRGNTCPDVHCIGEGVDLNGKMKQIERWNHGSAKVLFHMMIPALFKSLLKGETKLFSDKKFFGIFYVFSVGISQRLVLLFLAFFPFLISLFIKVMPTDLSNNFHYLSLFYVSVILSFLAFFLQIFNVQNRVSASPFRIIFLDFAINIQGLVGFIKGILGLTPKTWCANKQKVYAQDFFIGNYLIVIVNAFAIFMNLNEQGVLYNIIWAFFFMFTFGGSVYFLNRKRKPSDFFINISKKFLRRTWLFTFLMSITTTTAFFILEFLTKPDAYKVLALCLILCMAFSSLGFGATYLIFLYRQKKLGFE